MSGSPPLASRSHCPSLLGGFALGLIPGAYSVVNRAAATFIDSAGDAHQALYGSSNIVTVPNPPSWMGLGLALGFRRPPRLRHRRHVALWA